MLIWIVNAVSFQNIPTMTEIFLASFAEHGLDPCNIQLSNFLREAQLKIKKDICTFLIYALILYNIGR